MMAQKQNSVKQIVVISGKGGTGKTMLSASFAVLAKNKVMVDCDVDAANLHLLLQPSVLKTHEFKGGQKAFWDSALCNQCGECRAVCRFDASLTARFAMASVMASTSVRPATAAARYRPASPR